MMTERIKDIQAFVLFILLVILSTMAADSCKKDNQEPDTIFPKAYFPVYPRSWWTYAINDSQILTSRTGDNYQLHSYKISFDYVGEPLKYSDPVYVPFLDSRPIYGYDYIEHILPPFGDYYTKWPILSETVGFEFERNWMDRRYGDFAEKVEVVDKIFNGSDSLLVLEGHWVYGDNISHKRYQEYTRGIGLTKDLIIDTVTQDTLFKKILLEYHIQH